MDIQTEKKHKIRATVAPNKGSRVLAAIVATLATILLTSVATPAEGQSTRCGSIQSRVNNAAPQATINLPDNCIYEEKVTINKPLILDGGPGVVITGSNVWKGWTKSGSYWISRKTVPTFATSGECQPGTGDRCRRPEQVFINGVPQRQVPSAPAAGQFALDGSRRVVLPTDPTGRSVRVSVRTQWIVGRASGVTLRNLTMRHAATDPRSGAIHNGGYSNWNIHDNALSDAHGSVVKLNSGTGLKLLRNNIFRGGQLGVGGARGAVEVRDNKIHDNNTESFKYGHQDGGLKLVKVQSLVATGNEIYNNNGNGLWCDADCTSTTIRGNRIHHNARKGISFEISSGAKIFDNVLWENGWKTPDGGEGAAIMSNSSSNVEIYGNTLAWNADGIAVVSRDRSGTAHDRVVNNYVHHNTVLAYDNPQSQRDYGLAWLQNWPGVLYYPSSNNRGAYNQYWYTNLEGSDIRYAWTSGLKLLREFNSTPGEEGAVYLTSTQKDSIVSSKGLTSLPARR